MRGLPRYLGDDGVESFCRRAVEEHGVLLLPSSVYQSAIADVPTDRFRIGSGRTNVSEALQALEQFLAS